jgi:hypothetical protein
MWLCTKLGFYSVVRKASGEIHVRARCKRDLEILKKSVGTLVGKSSVRPWKIHRTEPADYRYRMIVTETGLHGIMTTLATELDYSNFKGEIASSGLDQSDKIGVYSHFHHEMERWQDEKENPSPLPVDFAWDDYEPHSTRS